MYAPRDDDPPGKEHVSSITVPLSKTPEIGDKATDGTLPNATTSPAATEERYNAFRRYSLIGSADDLKKEAQEHTPLLGTLCLKGQATVIYAKPNTGKTLLVLRLLMDAVDYGRIDGDDVIYFGADDSAAGIIDKIGLLEKHGVHVVVPGYRQFTTASLPAAVREMITTNTARGRVLILDTLKKFVSLMDKRDSSTFTDLARQFVMKGGTIVALAHTNKRVGSDGRPIFAGTSDILDDFDCGHTIVEIGNSTVTHERVVQFDCIKSRGDVAQQVAYGYSIREGLTYAEMLASVRVVSQEDATKVHQATELQSDAGIIEVVEGCIGSGINTKMALVKAVSTRFKIGEHAAAALIQKYAGSDPNTHRWDFDVGERGKQVFRVLDRPTVAKAPPPEDIY